MHAKLLMMLMIGDGRAAWVEGMRRALAEALDPEVQLQVSAQPTASGLERMLGQLDQRVTVVAVDFPASPLEARVRLRAPGRALERRLAFQSGDAEVERGRALGFLISTMVPELRADRTVAQVRPPPPARPVEPPRAPESVVEAPPVEPLPAEPLPAEPPPAEPPPAEPPPVEAPVVEAPAPVAPPAAVAQAAAPSPAKEKWSLSLGASAFGGWGAGRAQPEGGLRVTAQLHLRRLAVRAGGLFLRGAVPQASAASTWLGPFIGASFALFERVITLALRVDLAAIWLQVTRADESQSRWLASVQPRLEASLALNRWLWVELAAGADLGPSPTRVFVNGAQVAELSPYSGAAELGLRVAF